MTVFFVVCPYSYLLDIIIDLNMLRQKEHDTANTWTPYVRLFETTPNHVSWNRQPLPPSPNHPTSHFLTGEPPVAPSVQTAGRSARPASRRRLRRTKERRSPGERELAAGVGLHRRDQQAARLSETRTAAVRCWAVERRREVFGTGRRGGGKTKFRGRD